MSDLNAPGALIEHWRKELAENIVSGKEIHELESNARLLEDEIERRGLQMEYAWALQDMTFSDEVIHEIGARELWWIIRATPQQRAQAFLNAIKDAK